MVKVNMRNLGVTVLGAFAASAGLAILISCHSDFESPYMPGSPGYAGDDWTRDADGNGIADSLDKYSPSCKSSPKVCLENAKVISRISSVTNTLTARDMLLWIGDSAQIPNLEWTPAEGALRGYVLASSDTGKVKIRGGRLLPVAKGSAQISVTVPGADSLSASFIAKVVSGGIRVESVSGKDLSVSVGKDTTALVTWVPADADFKDYSLISDQPLVARVVGQTIRGVFPGKANLTLVTMDGSHKTAFSVTVTDGPQVVYTAGLSGETMFLVKGAKAESPVLHWLPANVTDKIYKLVPVEPGIIAVTADSQQVRPMAVGTTTVLAKALDGSGKATEFIVTVVAQAVAVTGIEASDMSLLVQDRDPVAPKLAWLPAEATNRKYSLASSDPGVAIVSSGMVMPIALGTSVFTVTTEEGGFHAYFTVTVSLPDTAIHVDSVAVAAFSMPVGSTRKTPVDWYPTNAGDKNFTLTSDDETVVKPSAENLTALRVGSANIRLTTESGAHTADFKVTTYPVEIPVTSISADSMSLALGQDLAASITVMPVDATNPGYELISQDTNIVTILSGPLVHAKGVGKALVTIKSPSGPSGTFPVVVNATAVKLISLSAANFTLNVGDAPRDANVSYTPGGATNKAVTLKSPSGNSVISINAQNKVVAVAPGKAPLTIVSVENPGIAVTCSVTVVALTRNLYAKDDTLRLGQGDKDVSVLLTWDPDNVTSKEFALKSNDSTIVKVTGAKTYKPVGGGKTMVVVKALDGSNKADTFNVWVKIPVTSVTAKDVTLKVTDPVYSTDPLMTILPASASDKNWFLYPVNPTASASVVSIQNGWQLKPVGSGSADIIVFSNDNNAIKDTFTVTITQPVTSITATGFSMKVGDPDRDPVISVLPANATDKTYTLTANTPGVADVVSNKVHAVAGGTATFTAVSNSDVTKAVQFTVTVNIPVISVTAADLSMRVGDPDREPGIVWNPAGATNKNFTLTSSNNAAVSIVGTKLHAAAAGISNVTVVPTDGGKADTLTVTVTQPVNGITVADITMIRPDGDKDPVITWNPTTASNKGYTLTGGSAGIATVVANRIHPVATGSVAMMVTTADGAKVDTFQVTVVVPVDAIKGTDISMRLFDPDVTPTIVFTPTDATNTHYTLVSQDTNVATIVNGKIHAAGRGTAQIVVTSQDNDKITNTFLVQVRLAGGG